LLLYFPLQLTILQTSTHTLYFLLLLKKQGVSTVDETGWQDALAKKDAGQALFLKKKLTAVLDSSMYII
jgi:hypothetical protein